MIADVGGLEREIVSQGALDTQIVSDDVGSAQVLVDAEDGARLRLVARGKRDRTISAGGRQRIDGHAGAVVRPAVFDGAGSGGGTERGAGEGNLADVDVAPRSGGRGVAVRVKIHAGGDGAQTEQIAERHEGIETALFVVQAAAAADNGPAASAEVPGEADTRREVVVIAVKGFAERAATGLEKTFSGDEISDQIVGFGENGGEFVSQTEVQGEARRHSPIVLHEKSDPFVLQVA